MPNPNLKPDPVRLQLCVCRPSLNIMSLALLLATSGEKLQHREFGRTTAHLGMQAAALTAIKLNKNYMTGCPEGFRPQISFISVFSQISGKETFLKNAAE